jgi:hypothetical protein
LNTIKNHFESLENSGYKRIAILELVADRTEYGIFNRKVEKVEKVEKVLSFFYLGGLQTRVAQGQIYDFVYGLAARQRRTVPRHFPQRGIQRLCRVRRINHPADFLRILEKLAQATPRPATGK